MPYRVGRYSLLGEIARGGMATVYLARALGMAGFERLFAVKVLHAHLAADPSLINMLLDEARLAAAIRHPNVVGIVDIVDSSRGPMLILEFVNGPSLKALMRGDVPLSIALRVIIDALAGLNAAHLLTDQSGESMRLVHRDVSPQNILVDVDGITRLTDFGVAHAAQRLQTTRGATLKGKLAYVAPEQVANEPVDARCDIYSAGVVLWEILTGERLHHGDHEAAILVSVIKGDNRSPRAVRPSVPDAIDAVTMRALAQDRDQRFSTAAEMSAALERAAETEDVSIATAEQVATFVQRAGLHRSIDDMRRAAFDLTEIQDVTNADLTRAVSPSNYPNAPTKRTSSALLLGAATIAAVAGVAYWLVTSAPQVVSAAPDPTAQPATPPSEAEPQKVVMNPATSQTSAAPALGPAPSTSPSAATSTASSSASPRVPNPVRTPLFPRPPPPPTAPPPSAPKSASDHNPTEL